jgi:LacI family transcriptional regulator
MQQHGLRTHSDVCVVRQDDRTGGRWLRERIRARGARCALAVVPKRSWPAIEERLVGFREALHGVCKIELFPIEEANLASVASDLVKRFFTSVPDVVIGGNDLLAAQAIQALHYHHLRVPNDVGVTGFNALPTTGFVDPPLVTVQSSAYQIGVEAANLLLGRLKTGRFAVREMVLPVEPVQGGSL